jgi:hypothetical protein
MRMGLFIRLYLGNERVRLWGYALPMAYRNYAEITNLAERYSKLGVNAARPFCRSWPIYGVNGATLPNFVRTTKVTTRS